MLMEKAKLRASAQMERDHIEGPKSVSLVLLEYGDYECPYCGIAHQIISEARNQLGERFEFVFRHFPLSKVHPHAFQAAAAAEAAGMQEAFWPMHHLLFENQRHLEMNDLEDYADEIGLDLETFRNDIGSDQIVKRIREDIRTGIRSGVNGTPSFFMNEYKFEGDWINGELVNDLETLVVPPHHLDVF